MAEPLKTLQVVEEIEGEHVETDDYFFCKVGESIPLTSADVVFDTDTVPSKPLAISPRLGLLLTAHGSGFCVTKVKDVLSAAKERKTKGSGSTVQELSVVDVDIGRVSILALSDDSSHVSAVVGNAIHFFSVDSLVNKDQKPIFSCSVEAHHVKDMLWIEDAEHSIIVLTDRKEMLLGALNKPSKVVMDEIDAVDKSVDGKCLAIGRKSNLSIVSLQFKELWQIVLPLSSVIGDSGAIDTVKVDSIRWIRSDSIVVGCIQQNENGEEENYFLQVITSEDGNFINGSSTVTALQFNDLFPGIVDDIVPYGCGPHLLMSYLNNCEFAFASNQKNTDQHIMLFSWSQGDSSVYVVDIERENWLPRIELQENGDDNLVLGLCVDETSIYENVEVKVGAEESRELRPHCLLVCLTLEGKLVMFNVASISGCHPSSQTSSTFSDSAQNIPLVSHPTLGTDPHPEKGITNQLGSVIDPRESNTKNVNSAPDFTVASPDNFVEKNLADANKDGPIKIGNNISQNISASKGSSSFLGFSGFSDARSSLFSPSSASTKSHLSGTPVTSTYSASNAGTLSEDLGLHLSDSSNSPIGKLANHGQETTSPSVVFDKVHSIPNSKLLSRETVTSHNITSQSMPLMKGNHNKFSSFGQPNSEQKASDQFGNVQNMAKELDKLSERIKERGNFNDMCISDRKSSLEALEEGMRSLLERNRECQNISEKRLRESEILLDKSVEVLARITHMKLMLRQTTDGQYLDMWDRQNLSSELDKKQQSILNLHQDLVNKTNELEKHFNALELNRFGSSSGTNMVSSAHHCRSATSRYSQSLNAIHNATISQLAAAEQLSNVLSKQMDVLSIKSPPAKQTSIKKHVFETIGIPYPEDNADSPHMKKMYESPMNKYSLVSSSSRTHVDFKRSQLSDWSSEIETSRRRRDSLDKNWAKLEVPKTMVKRMPVTNERHNSSSLFSSVDKRSVSPFNLEEDSMATHSKNLIFHDKNGGKSMDEKVNSGYASTSAFKWAGGTPETSKNQAEQYTRSPPVQGNSFPTVQNIFASNSSSSLSSSLSSWAPERKTESSHAITEQWAPNIQNIQHPSPPLKYNQMSIPSSKDSVFTKPDINSPSMESTSKIDVQFSSASRSFGTSTSCSSSLPTLGTTTLPVTSIKGPLEITGKVVKDVSRVTPSLFPVSSSPAASLNHVSSKDPPTEDSNSMGSLSFVDKVNAEANLETSTHAAYDKPKSEGLTPSTSSTEDSNLSGSSPGLSKPVKVASDVASNVPTEKQSTGFTLSPVPFSDLGSSFGLSNLATVASSVAFNVTSNTPTEKQSTASTIPPMSLQGSIDCRKNNSEATISQEDEMEEEAPESNQAADFSLANLAGFGIGTPVSSTTPKPNPFGVSLSGTPQSTPTSSLFTDTQGQLFRPASFSFQSPVSQQTQSPNMGPSPGAFGSASPQQVPAASGFGQPGQIGSGGGQQAWGSVLGSFGQSRQIGSGFGAAPSLGGGFSNLSGAGGGFAGASPATGGFAGVSATSGGFAGISATGGGFAGIGATASGFAAAATPGGGFAAAAPSGGGFAAAAGSSGGGFGGFSGLGGGAAGGKQSPSALFTQMRR